MITCAEDTARCAVLFIKGGRVTRQMLYAEFESLAFRMVAIAELAGRQQQAVFVTVDMPLSITEAVFFLVEFDRDGLVSADWRLSLASLRQTAQPGPDLGAGPIRLVSRHHCTPGVDAELLWEVSPAQSAALYDTIAGAIRENRLGLSVAAFREPPPARPVHPPRVDGIPILSAKADTVVGHEERSKRNRTARTIMGMRQKLSTLKFEQGSQLALAASRNRVDLDSALRDGEQFKWRLAEERRVNERLRQALGNQTEAFKRLRSLISSQIGKIELGEQMGRQLLDEFNHKLAAATAELQDDMARKDSELHQRDEQVGQLSEQVQQLERRNAALKERLEGGELLRRMKAAGITHRASQPGAGEFQVAAEDVAAYLGSPEDYAARYCCVESDHYKAWLAHDRRPICGNVDSRGRHCELPVHRVASPATFIIGESDRCSQHRSSSLALRKLLQQH